MDTMIQKYKLQEADYRSDRFANRAGQDLVCNPMRKSPKLHHSLAVRN